VLLARREERLRELGAEINAEWEVCDVGDRAAVERTAASVLERHPAVGLLVNNAGLSARSNFLSAEPDRIEEVTRVNYFGGIWCLRAFLAGLEAAAPSHVVNVVSVAGTVAAGTSGPYTASKHAQLAFSRATQAELRRRRISVHTILPGFIETEGFPQRRTLPRWLHWAIGRPEEVAEAIVGAVEQGKPELFVPRWYRAAMLAQALTPGVVRRLGGGARKTS
jgi:short-subunit dehydrogenase